jgi:hypothetical protein
VVVLLFGLSWTVPSVESIDGSERTVSAYEASPRPVVLACAIQVSEEEDEVVTVVLEYPGRI